MASSHSVKEDQKRRNQFRRVFKCENCRGFFVQFVRPTGSSADVPFNLKAVPPEHSVNCPEVPIVSSNDVLTNLQLVVDYLKSYRSMKGTMPGINKITEHFSLHQITLDLLKASVSRAINAVQRNLRVASAEYYMKLPRLL